MVDSPKFLAETRRKNNSRNELMPKFVPTLAAEGATGHPELSCLKVKPSKEKPFLTRALQSPRELPSAL